MKEDKTGKIRLSASIQTLVKNEKIDTQGCTHLQEIQDVTPSAAGCEDCLKTGDKWLFLRVCLICGHVGCCDNSKNKHATRHFKETGHPMIASYEPEENWLWCYPDEIGWQL